MSLQRLQADKLAPPSRCIDGFDSWRELTMSGKRVTTPSKKLRRTTTKRPSASHLGTTISSREGVKLCRTSDWTSRPKMK